VSTDFVCLIAWHILSVGTSPETEIDTHKGILSERTRIVFSISLHLTLYETRDL
jgi:hypothetical protein